jgi:hypothetical protein
MTERQIPGPWYSKITGHRQGLAIDKETGSTIAVVYGHRQGLVIDEETGATIAVVYDADNVQLIAKAPELLAAAEIVVGAWESGDLAGAVSELAAVAYEAQAQEEPA